MIFFSFACGKTKLIECTAQKIKQKVIRAIMVIMVIIMVVIIIIVIIKL